MLVVKYKNWKGQNIQDAEIIRDDLSKKLGRRSTKRDFIANGHYAAWMALYRYQKKELRHSGDLENKYLSFRNIISETRNTALIKRIFTDFVNKLGIDEAQRIIDSMEKPAASVDFSEVDRLLAEAGIELKMNDALEILLRNESKDSS
jgi:hypothetical protein